MGFVTRAQLAILAPKADSIIAAAIADHADDVLPRYGLATPLRLSHFMAHVLVESSYLTRTEENLNYTAERAHEVWPQRFPTVASAQPYERNPRALANRVYGGRMGNVGPDDGWLNRGMGLMQTTGGSWRIKLAAKLGVTSDEVRAMLISPDGMLECAAATYVLSGAPAYADRDDIEGETRVINGGLNGLADRRAMLDRCARIWSTISAPVPIFRAAATASLPAALESLPVAPPIGSPVSAPTIMMPPPDTGLLARLRAWLRGGRS